MKSLIISTTVLVETSPQALPLGAACVASAVKSNELTAGKFDVDLKWFSKEDTSFFENEKKYDISAAAEKIAMALFKFQNTKLFAVCFSVYLWNRQILEAVAQKVKERDSSVYCLAGGPEVTANPFTFQNFDFLCVGEGETAMPELIAILSDKTSDSPSLKLPQGIYRAGTPEGPIQHAVPADILKIPSPYLDGTMDVTSFGGALWELARGCPYACSYCYESKGERRIRFFPEDRLMKELDFFYKHNVAQVFVLDPTYNANNERAIRILNVIAKKAPGIFFYFEARAELINRKLAQAFTKIPCAVQIGLQSADEKVLALVHRTLDKKLFIRNIGFLNECGVIFGFDLIFGLPGDTLEGFKKSIDFAIKLYPNNLELFCLSVLPGTDLYDRADDLYLEYLQHPPYHVIKTKTFSVKEMSIASKLSRACAVFYNQGRAVPWFNSLLHVVKIKSSLFFEEFADFLDADQTEKESEYERLPHKKIEKLQIEFIQILFKKKNKSPLINVALDLIRLNGALSRSLAEGTSEIVQLHYHPDDLMSQYATDLFFFMQNAQKFSCQAKVFHVQNGSDWQVIKR